MRLTLDRFKSAQEGAYEQALAEIKEGKKTSHWIWFIFPQLQGLGTSNEAWYFGIQDREEALAYMADPLLSARLLEISEELLKLEGPIEAIVGYPDNLKICSSMTLFALVSQKPVFRKVLDRFYGGRMDLLTEARIAKEAK